jgi:hypothetical protein
LVAIQQLQRLRPRSEQKRSPGCDQARGTSSQSPCAALCRTLYLIAHAAGATSCVGVVAHLDGFAMISLSRRHDGCIQAVPGYRRRFGATRDLKELRSQLYDQNNRCRCQNRRRPWSGQIDTDSIPLRSAKLPNLAARHAESRRPRLPQASRVVGVFLVLILGRFRNCGVCCFRLLDAEFLEALIFGLG